MDANISLKVSPEELIHTYLMSVGRAKGRKDADFFLDLW
jgi:hypothetical protein